MRLAGRVAAAGGDTGFAIAAGGALDYSGENAGACATRGFMPAFLRCIWAVLVAMTLPVQAADQLNLVANYWEPYTGDGLPGKGLASEIVTTALKNAGYAATVSIMPWARALALTYAGNADGIVAVWATRERRQNLVLSDAYLSNRMVLLHMHGKYADRKTLADLSGLTVGVGRNYDYSDAFSSSTNFNRRPADRVLQNLHKLSVGRVDLVLEDDRIAQYNLTRYRDEIPALGEIELIKPPLFVLPLYFGVSRKHADAEVIVARFNDALKKMQANGTMDAILSRFNQRN